MFGLPRREGCCLYLVYLFICCSSFNWKSPHTLLLPPPPSPPPPLNSLLLFESPAHSPKIVPEAPEIKGGLDGAASWMLRMRTLKMGAWENKHIRRRAAMAEAAAAAEASHRVYISKWEPFSFFLYKTPSWKEVKRSWDKAVSSLMSKRTVRAQSEEEVRRFAYRLHRTGARSGLHC